MQSDNNTANAGIAHLFHGTKVEHGDLVLQPLRKKDIEELSSWPKFKEKHLSWANFPASTKELQNRWYRHQQKDHLIWIIIRDENNDLIGRCSITKPLSTDELLFGVVLRPDMVGQGLGTTITRIMLSYIFGVTDASAVWLESRYDNIRAQRTWEKVGFKPMGYHFRREVFGRYDKYLAYRFERSQQDILPDITIERTS